MNIAIVDDQRVYHDILSKRLENVFEYPLFIYCFGSTVELDNSNMKFELILMDIDMPSVNGMDYTKVNLDKNVVFITSHDSYMKNAFGPNVYAFIHKNDPINEFKKKIREAIELISQQKVIHIKTDFEKLTLFQKDIIYLQYIGRKTISIKLKNTEYIIRGYGLNEFLQRLEPNFMLCDRDIIINIDKIFGYTNENKLIVKDVKNKINMSSRASSSIKKAYALRIKNENFI